MTDRLVAAVIFTVCAWLVFFCISSATEDAEVTDLDIDGAADIKLELPNTMNTEQISSRQCGSIDGHLFPRRVKNQIKRKMTEEAHRCETCGQCFARARSLSAHVRSIHTTGKGARNNVKLGTRTRTQLSNAPQTSKQNPYARRLRSSQKSVSGDATDDPTKRHACSVCQRRFRLARDLELHSRIHSGLKPNTCSFCGKNFTTISQLRSHHRTHTQELTYECSVCGEKFVWLNSLKRHMRLHPDANDDSASAYSCSVCSESFDFQSELDSHHILVHGTENLSTSGVQKIEARGRRRHRTARWSGNTRSSCEVCGKSVADMRKHMLTHSGEKRHQCILCGSCFSIPGTLTVHMRMHTGERPFGCEDCGKRFTTRSHLTVHKRKHTREEPYQCALCGEKFVWLNSMKRHVLLHDELDSQQYGYAVDQHLLDAADTLTHVVENSAPFLESTALEGSALETVEWPGSQDPSAPCKFCGKTFADMRKHLETHAVRRSHECSECRRCYTTPDSLRTHMKIHTGEKKFVCAECGSRFRHMSHLRVHMRIHSEELRYECSICGDKFLWQNSLKRHLWKHDGGGSGGVQRERKHPCTICGKSFFTAYLLRIHVQSHSGDKPHMCHQCGRRYATRSSLLCHQRYSHFAQPQPCPECGKQFKSLRVVKQHMRISHRGAMHKCEHCGMEFRQRDWLDWHTVTHSSHLPFTCDECCNDSTGVLYYIVLYYMFNVSC